MGDGSGTAEEFAGMILARPATDAERGRRHLANSRWMCCRTLTSRHVHLDDLHGVTCSSDARLKDAFEMTYST